MSLSDFQKFYHILLVFNMDVIKIKDLVFYSGITLNQIDLLLSAVGLVLSRLSSAKSDLEKKRSDLIEKKNEQTLF